MNLEVFRQRYPLPSAVFQPYLRRGVLPPLDVAQLSTSLLIGSERSVLKTPTTGTVSNILSYKGKEGAVSSFEERGGSDMVLVQLQGARSSVSWRVATGLSWDLFLMAEAVQMACLNGSEVRRIGMPNPLYIKGIEHAESEEVVNRYRAFITYAALQWSQEDQLFVRDI